MSDILARLGRCTLHISALTLPLVLAACGGDAKSKGGDAPTSTGDESSVDASTTTPGDGNQPGAPGTGTDPDASTTDPDAPTVACDDAQTAAVQAALDKSHPKDIDAVAVVRDPCGVRYFTSGPSKYPRTVLHKMASNTKTYVASLVILLVEDGVLNLDTPISTWIDKVPGGDKVHLRHLLYQNSGIYNYSDDKIFMAGAMAQGNKKWNPQEQVDLAFKHDLAYEPGNGWNYSNTNYTLLGMIIEKATGKKAVQLIHERILDKLGLTNTFFPTQDAITGTVAKGKGTFGDNVTDPSFQWTAGEVIATPDDLAIWAEKRATRAFHSPKGNDMLFAFVPTTGDTLKYGAAFMDYDASVMPKGGEALGHGGDWFGYHSYALYFPSRKTTISAVVDSDAGPDGAGFPLGGTYIYDIVFAILDGLFPNPVTDAATQSYAFPGPGPSSHDAARAFGLDLSPRPRDVSRGLRFW